MAAEYIQLVGTDVPGSYGSCCFSGQVQHEALHCPTQPLALSSPSPTPSTGVSTAVNGDGQLLFFNCPEGTQRFSSEANMRLVRTRGFFFTRWAVSAVMGMPGLLFTINDAGVRHANFFGPSSYSLTVEDGDGAQTQQPPFSAGLEGMLGALRLHYFWYRTMSFQQLRVGAVLRQLPTALPWNYVCEVPLHPLEEGEGGTSANPHDMPSSSSSASSFFVLALLLSSTSALLGFRVSRKASTPSEETYGYAILHAPKACFDPKRAKAFGVPPGPMYGQLKQGIGVWIDDEQSSPCVAHPAEKSRRFIHPRSVKQATVGSRCMYVSLVLDGDDSGEVAEALESLFGRDASNRGDQQEEGVTADAESERLRSGELRRFLVQWQPFLLFCDDDHAASGEATVTAHPPMERTIVLRHVVHVQCSDFFSSFAAGAAGSVEAHYVTSIFTRVQREVREQAVESFRHDRYGGDSVLAAGAKTGTMHHFCAAVQQQFSAFPTALAHRYHLNCIANAQFPITLPSAGEKEHERMKEDTGRIWPYAVKHLLIPPEAAGHIPHNTYNLAMKGPAFHVATFSSLVPGSKQQKRKGGNSNKEDVSVLLRYPTARSAVDMLSQEFRSIARRVHEQMQSVLLSPSSFSSVFHHSHGDTHDNFHGICGHKDSGNTWHLDGGGALTFLGTGSAMPSKYRNVSGTYLEVMYQARSSTTLSRAVVVLDFGEGNAGQLAIFWGNGFAQALFQFFNDLVFVFISHAHADHHLGLMTLLELRHRVRLQVEKQDSIDSGNLNEPLLVVCPQEVHEFLQDTWGRCTAYRQWLEEEVVYDVFPAERHRVGEAPATSVLLPRLNALCARLDEKTAATNHSESHGASPPVWGAEVFPVDHPANAHALLLRFPAPMGATNASRVFLFSGDTRPSPLLIERCRKFTRWTCRVHEQREEEPKEEGDDGPGVFLCLHEATFGEDCGEEAVQKCHSTLPEALQVAAAIRAEHVVLNHFSQRYPKLPGLMKSQLNGRDVDLYCKRRKPRPPDALTALTESSLSEEAVKSLEDVQRGDTSKRKPLDTPSSGELKMCFGFDFMRLSFTSLESQQTAQLTPLFVQLLEEYESWGVGTTKRLRG
ncbi:hypothetical protein ECC02_000676 [Trypanosoma cruzi]|uniref:ribonuclease Z n=1 Tax=Trypanosoma cruzi TaxID=5693 RepID=A0A7J6YHF6_TRYCR|nr:hypothetical protein ECC02_000676 [Trypanosoma cruzi]